MCVCVCVCVCYIIHQGLVRLMNQVETVGPVNIGNPREFTIKELAELIVELTGNKSSISYLPLPKDDPKQRKPDISRARKYLFWEPQVQAREGLERTINYFRGLDMRHFKKPTNHTAHCNSEADDNRVSTM